MILNIEDNKYVKTIPEMKNFKFHSLDTTSRYLTFNTRYFPLFLVTRFSMTLSTESVELQIIQMKICNTKIG